MREAARQGALPQIVVAGRAAPLLPRATTRVHSSPRHHPCPYYDSEPLARPRRRHRRGTYMLTSLEHVSGREGRGEGGTIVPTRTLRSPPPSRPRSRHVKYADLAILPARHLVAPGR